MIENYKYYLEFLNKKLGQFFEEQSPYIFCKKGCAECCKNAQFPYSELEAVYLTLGFHKLDEDKKNIVLKNMAVIKAAKKDFSGEKFLYTCPFLIDDVCSVYEYRGIVCRTFGLMASSDDDNAKIPFCHAQNLNYSNVTDLKRHKISREMYEQSGIDVEPQSYNISYDFLTSEKTEKAFNITFGDKKPLIEWFLNNNRQY